MLNVRAVLGHVVLFAVALAVFWSGASAEDGAEIASPTLPWRQSTAAPVTECDRLVNYSRHPDSVLSTSIGFLKIDSAVAIPICLDAKVSHPDVRRFDYLLGRAYRKEGKYELARASYRLAAQRGDVYAMLELASMSVRGQGGSPDLTAAAGWIERAAATGHPEALVNWSNYHKEGTGISYDPDRAFQLARQAAEAGWPSALTLLADLYRRGIGTDSNPQEAERLSREVYAIEKARAESGDPDSMLRVGRALQRGHGVERDPAAGFAWLLKAKSAGHSDADFALGWAYANGLGVASQKKEACDHYEQAAARLGATSINNYASCFLEGGGRPQDLARARQLYAQAVERGSGLAARNLGRMFRDGRGVAIDLGKAAQYFKVAAEHGHVGGMFEYAYALDSERGVKRDTKLACDWYERAANVGSAQAANNLAFCYEDGNGRTKDVEQAIRLFEKASKRGSSTATNNLAVRYDEGRGVEKDPARANQLFETAAEEGHSGAAVRLGYNLVNGIGVSADKKKGCDWFEKAAEQGEATAINNLGTCYVDGEGRPKDVKKAVALFQKAIELNSTLAMRNMFVYLLDGQIVQRDVARALRLLNRAAEAGDAIAMSEFARRLYWGEDTKADKKMACVWFDKATRERETPAWAYIYSGECWEKGLGRERNRRKAFEAYKTSAEAGSIVGMQMLARAYDEAIGTKRDGEAAARWLRKSLAAGNEAIARQLITAPHTWHITTRRSLQKLLNQEGIYAGSVDGTFSSEMDVAIWSRALGDGIALSEQRLKQEIVRIKTEEAPNGLPVRLCRAAKSAERQRLIIINHGLTTDRSKRRIYRPNACGPLAEFFAKRGFLVAFPLRRGYGDTNAKFAEDVLGRCSSSAFIRAGNEMARDISAVLDALLQRSDVEPQGAVVIGHSGGGWATVALSGKNPELVSGYINFSGGHGTNRGVPGTFCPTSLTAAMATFGKSSRKPVLWLYVQNDSYIGSRIAQRMFNAFRHAGGNGEFVMMPPFKKEGHYLFGDDTVDVWGPAIDKWLIGNLKGHAKHRVPN